MKSLKAATIVCLLVCSAIMLKAQDKKKPYELSHYVAGMQIAGGQYQPEFSINRPYLNDMKEMQRRKYVVILAKENADEIKDIGKDTKLLSIYKHGLQSTNENLEATLTKFWTICPTSNIEYKTPDEFDAIQNKSDYFVVFCYNSNDVSRVYKKEPLYKCGLNANIRFMRYILEGDSPRIFERNGTFFAIEKPETNEIIFSQAIPDIFPTKADLAMAIHMASVTNDIYKSFKPNDIRELDSADCLLNILQKADIAPLQSKTLLIRRDWIGDKISESDLKTLYPYTFRLVSSNELDEEVMNDGKEELFVYPEFDFSLAAYSESTGYTIGGRPFYAKAIYVTMSIVDASNIVVLSRGISTFSVYSPRGGFGTMLDIYIQKEDIDKWKKNAEIPIKNASNLNNCQTYAGVITPIVLDTREPKTPQKFIFKTTKLDSCYITITKPTHGFSGDKEVFQSNTAATQYWNGYINGSISSGNYEYMLQNSACGIHFTGIKGSISVVK